jgi:hypothetical protein
VSRNYVSVIARKRSGTGCPLQILPSTTRTPWRNATRALERGSLTGCGKTVLSSTIIEHLESVTGPAQGLLCFYFDFNDKKKQTLEDMLRSLVDQLYQRHPDARDPLDRMRASSQHLSKTSLIDVLLAMLGRINDVSVVLDALDESTTRNDVLTWLRSVIEADSIACRFLVTSRREEDIEQVLGRWTQPGNSIRIQGSDVNEDIRTYVRYVVRNSEELDRWHKLPNVQEEIEMALVDGADGM